MGRHRAIEVLSALAAASLVVAACSGDGNDDVASGGSDITTASAERTADDGGTDTAAGITAESSTPARLPGAEDVGKVGGSGCGIPHGPFEKHDEGPSGEVRVAWEQAPYSFNSSTNRGNAAGNSNPLWLMKAGQSGDGFLYYDKDLNLINNDQFGTCTVDSLDPLTVTYTINEGVTWSDGAPVDAVDVIIEWAAQSGVFNDANTVVTDSGVTAQADADGNPIIVGPDGVDINPTDEAYEAAFDGDGALLAGFTYKESTGLSFDTASESFQLITEFPKISADGRSVTATWDSFFVDYQTGGLTTGVPAHVIGKRALGVADPVAAKAALIDALRTAYDGGDTAPVKKIAESYNRDFDATSLPADAGIYAGFGPYNLVAFTDDGTMTFEAREDYTWGPQPKVQTIVYSTIGDPSAAVQAMENEEVDVIQPQATADILTQLQGMADRGVEVIQDDEATYEHIDLAQNNGGPFDPAAYGGDAAKALAVRRAFLHAVPRQDIVDRLIKPLNENATVRNAQVAVPGEPFYDELVASNGSDEYAETDVATSKMILADGGIDTSKPIAVRLLFDSQNTRRQAEYDLIRGSVAQAGFDLVNVSRADWAPTLANTSVYDASVFGWQTVVIAVAASMPNYVADGMNNFSGYDNPKVDALADELNETSDAVRQHEILIEVEKHLFADAFGLPIFQFPAITAYNSNYVKGVSNTPLAPTMLFDVWDWEAAS